jgi:hypothetical protein
VVRLAPLTCAAFLALGATAAASPTQSMTFETAPRDLLDRLRG